MRFTETAKYMDASFGNEARVVEENWLRKGIRNCSIVSCEWSPLWSCWSRDNDYLMAQVIKLVYDKISYRQSILETTLYSLRINWGMSLKKHLES